MCVCSVLSFSLELNGQAALSLGSIVNRLLFVFPCSSFKALHSDTLRLFMDAMTDLTCSFLQATAKEEEVSPLTSGYCNKGTCVTNNIIIYSKYFSISDWLKYPG